MCHVGSFVKRSSQIKLSHFFYFERLKFGLLSFRDENDYLLKKIIIKNACYVAKLIITY